MTVSVSTADAGAGGVRRTASQRAILEAVRVTVPVKEPAAGYRAAITALVCALVFLGMAFVGLLIFLALMVLGHLLGAMVSLTGGGSVLGHMVMAGLAALLLVFLVKPIFFRLKGRKEELIVLRAEEEPVLFEFMAGLAKAVGIPRPEIIEVDCQANASASFHRGIFGLMQKKLVLRIGLPLAGAFTVNQLAGVCAHEFGHFAQRGGMSGQFFVRHLMYIFAKIVFQRDRVDEYLLKLRYRGGWGTAAYFVAKGFVEPARGVLWLMLIVGEMLSRHALRRMEFDADEVEAMVAGSASFEEVSRKIVALSFAQHRMMSEMRRSWEQRRLADDVPRLVVMDAKLVKRDYPEVLAKVEEAETKWYDTHPCHKDRVAAAVEMGAEALVVCNLPASKLFADFQSLCRRATRGLYEGVLGKQAKGATLIATAEMAGEISDQVDKYKALDALLCGHAATDSPIFPVLGGKLSEGKIDKALDQLLECRQTLRDTSKEATKTIEALQQATAELAAARAHSKLAKLFPRNPKAASLHRKAANALKLQNRLQESSRNEIGPFEFAARTRFTIGLQLAALPGIAKGLKDPAGAEKTLATFLPLADALQDAFPSILVLREQVLTLRVLYGVYNAASPYPPLVREVLELNRQMAAGIGIVRKKLGQQPFPFEHAYVDLTAAEALVEKTPNLKDPGAVYAWGARVVERYYDLTFRSMSRLAALAVEAEVAAGLAEMDIAPRDNKAKNEERKVKEQWKEWMAIAGHSVRAAAGLVLLFGLIWLSVGGSSGGKGPGGGRGGTAAPVHGNTGSGHGGDGLESQFDDAPRGGGRR